MERGSLNAQKHTSGEAPKVCSVFGVRCSVCTITCSQAMLAADAARVRRSLAPIRARSLHAAGAEPRHTAHGTLVNASVCLKPAKLVDVALDMLARLAPCLNLRVGELGHKDLLDTIGADNRRK